MNTAAIATHLNVLETAIVRCEEWANVIFCVVKGLGARFVSKKVIKMDRKKVSAKGAAEAFQAKYGGNVWSKKTDEIRWYKGKGYLRFAVGTEANPQIKWFLKSYEITPEIEESVEKFNANYEIASIQSSQSSQRKCWRDEDGNEVDEIANPAEAVYYG